MCSLSSMSFGPMSCVWEGREEGSFWTNGLVIMLFRRRHHRVGQPPPPLQNNDRYTRKYMVATKCDTGKRDKVRTRFLYVIS